MKATSESVGEAQCSAAVFVYRQHTWLSAAAGAQPPVIVPIHRLIKQIISGLLFKPEIKVRDAAR